MNQVNKIVQKFYNKTPFPDYDLNRFNDIEDLRLAVWRFADIIDRSIPENASIIDVGCGTGMLPAYLSLRKNRKVVGIDFCDTSLNKAKALKEKLNLNVEYKKINILNEKEIKSLGKFDYVLCLGVLHHTGEAKKGFENLCKLVKPNGKIVVGLYNKIGRIPLKIRIILSKTIFKNNEKVKDYFIRMQIGDVEDKERRRGWWNDQYEHPHETTHTIGEVLKWFKGNDIKYINTIPTFSDYNLSIAGIFQKSFYPYFPIRFYNQLKWFFTTHKEGGYWITIGEYEN